MRKETFYAISTIALLLAFYMTSSSIHPLMFDAFRNRLLPYVSNHFDFISVFLLTLLGAAINFFTGAISPAPNFIGAFRKILPNKSSCFYERLNLVAMVVFGATIGYLLFKPHDAYSALAAGFGWSAAINRIGGGRDLHS